MSQRVDLTALKGRLFGMGAMVFAILDGAIIPDLPAALSRHRLEHLCLFRGALEPDMVQVAPYLVTLEPDAPGTDWALSNGFGVNRGVFGVSQADLYALNRHFRRFVIMQDESGESYFRFYDSAVLRNYLPTCTAEELRIFFGAVEIFLMGGEGPDTVLAFWLKGDELRRRSLSLREETPVLNHDESASLRAQQTASGGAGRLTLRGEQLRQIGMSVYVERMRDYLYEVLPATKATPRDILDGAIVELTERAAGYKLVLETHVAPFIVAAMLLGMDFDERFPVAADVLLDYEMDCGRKAEWLWDFIPVAARAREEEH